MQKPFEISDFDDLVFEHRNRDYGAYQLRRRYNRAVLTGVLVASLFAFITVVIPFLKRPSSEMVLSGGNGYVQLRMQNFQPPVEKIYVPPAPPPREASKIPESVRYVPPVVVDSVSPDEPKQVSTDAVIASDDRNVVEASGSGFGENLLPGDGTGGEVPLFIVEVMPTFKGGGIDKFHDWVWKRTQYPEAAIANKIRGTVFLTFIVEKDGSVSNVIVIKGVHPLLDQEAIKVISESPKWSPGLQRGQPVRVRFQIPISFTY